MSNIKRLTEARGSSPFSQAPRLFRLNFTYPCCSRQSYKLFTISYTAAYTFPETSRPITCNKCGFNLIATFSSRPNDTPRRPGKGNRAKALISCDFNFAAQAAVPISIMDKSLYPKLCTSKCKNYTKCKKCKKCRCFMLQCGALT
jgi:hypothetical protein